VKNLIRSASLLTALVLALTGCSGDRSGSPDGSGGSGHSEGAAAHDDADVIFAGEMVPHHAQALRMVAMTRGRHLTPSFEALARHIKVAQTREVETMRGWLEDWGRDPDGITGHMHGDDESMGGSGTMGGSGGLRGMMSGRDLRELGAASGHAFEDMWLRMMIRHHQGAIAMADVEVAHGQYPAAIDLAQHVESVQQGEIDLMRKMLAH